MSCQIPVYIQWGVGFGDQGVGIYLVRTLHLFLFVVLQRSVPVQLSEVNKCKICNPKYTSAAELYYMY